MQATSAAEFEDENVTETIAGTTASEERVGYDTVPTPSDVRPSRHREGNQPTFVLKTHDGDGYVLPYSSWETTKLQIEQIYKLRGRTRLAEAAKDGNFSMLNENGDIILPAFWESVVSPSAVVQVSLPSDVLDGDIASFYPYEDRSRGRYRRSTPSVRGRPASVINSVAEDSERAADDDDAENDSSSSDEEEESDLEFSSSESDLSEAPVLTEVAVEITRPAIAPVDNEGNSLAFQVNTAFIGPLDRPAVNADNRPGKREPQQSIGDPECLSVTKAVATEVESRNTLQLFVLPGPRGVLTHPDISMRWFHLQSERLDFVGFKETCLSISGQSQRLHKLTRKLFERVEKDKIKAFLDGMFIEPGTVLRADESHQSDPQSVMFSCLPYFDLQTTAKKSSVGSQTDRLFPPRTLMQSYYPYEPVRDRDAEQAYRKFGNEKANALVHVPNLWMVNIGSSVIVTCGHQALSESLVQSIEVVEVDRGDARDEDHATNIRLTDWDGRKLLYSRKECRSYFQMEQNLKELRWCTSHTREEKSLQLFWQTSGSRVKVTPGLWPGILRERLSSFIDVGLYQTSEEGVKDLDTARRPAQMALSPSPFFHWPQTTDTEELKADGVTSADLVCSTQCLEHVEKAMLSEVLSDYGTFSAVEKTFTSTAYYRALPLTFSAQVKAKIELLDKAARSLPDSRASGQTAHQVLLHHQRKVIAQKTLELCRLMNKTLALFVIDVDGGSILRKSWSAMNRIGDLAYAVCQIEPMSPDPDEYSDPHWTHPDVKHRGWFVRPDYSDIQATDSLKKLERTFEKCSKCRTNEIYSTPQAAMLHLERHLKHVNVSASGSVQLVPESCIVNYAQMKMETWGKGNIAILSTVCAAAQRIYAQAEELWDGVRNEDGQMSDLYTFPRALLSAFRQLVVFYFAAERALHYAEESFKDKTNAFESPEYLATKSFSPDGLRIIEAFSTGVEHALTSARNELCSMVKSAKPVDVFKRLSLSPEYVCSWFMRRLIVKPLEKSMTVSDMYREYLSTIQFQVNHRPGKRLLRSINLLHEELTALREVNTQQSKLISNYISVLDDATYEKDLPSRRAMFPYERMLLASCQDSLQLTDQEYRYLLARCGPLSDSTKQSLEINEEDHGKAIMVFTIVTIIFLPLSFVTSFLGMNTTDIRDMGSSSSLFWAIAVPLTAVTMGSILYIGYNGDELRDAFSSLYRTITGKQDRSASARGISVAQRKRARKIASTSNSTVDFTSLADEAEFANPRPDDYPRPGYRIEGAYYGEEEYPGTLRPPRQQYTLEPPTMKWEPYTSAPKAFAPPPGARLRTQTYIPQTYTRPEVRTYEPITMEVRRKQASYVPPPRHSSPPPERFAQRPYSFSRPVSVQEYAGRERVRISPRREYSGRESAPAQYEWTKKSHKHHRHVREGRGRKRDGRRDAWDLDEE